MLKIEHLSRAYGELLAANDVSFTIQDGEIVGLLGHNGAGKTTIMKMLSGYLEPSNGYIEIDDIDLAKDRAGVQRRIGYLPETLPIYPEMSVADYLNYAANLKGLMGDEAMREIRRVIEATDIGPKMLAPISTLSRGYKQRVGVAQAILGRPKLLILDEPTNGLDPTQTHQMRRVIQELAKEATVILSTHIMQEVDAICDRVLIMRAGQLVVDERLEELRKSNSLMIATDLIPKEAEALLKTTEGICQIESLGEKNGQCYRLILREGSDSARVAHAVAKTLIEKSHAIYVLTPEQRDLESVFREVNEKEELAHAA
jgi:ABC-2 type transport system ATP-binding protein